MLSMNNGRSCIVAHPSSSRCFISSTPSQSRMWENLVGRSMPFWTHYYPQLVKVFPTQFNGVDLDKFYKGINKVEPFLIRVEADEATYNLHIMLRLELEIDLVEGNIEVKDLPEVWNTRIEDYLESPLLMTLRECCKMYIGQVA